MTRIPIGSSDFDLAPWAYNERPVNDMNLSNFTRLDKRDEQRVSDFMKYTLWKSSLYLYFNFAEHTTKASEVG